MRSFKAPVGTVVTAPNGAQVQVGSNNIAGVPYLTSQSQAAGSGCAASTQSMMYDANGNVLSKDDFQGDRICFAYDSSNRETLRVEGLANTVDCASVTPANAVLPAGARRIATQWHADWRLPITVTRVGVSISTTVYHRQPDPFNANAVANCATAPNLPNGKPRPLVCKQVEQAMLVNGTLDTSVPNRTTTYTYNASGKVLTSTDPNNRLTTYSYYTDTAFTGVDPNAIGHTTGDLQSITNPAGHITSFTSYDKAGRIRQSIDAKGITTDTSYTPRGWVSSTSVTPPGGTPRSTSYSYDAAGQLKVVTQPDGSTVTYSYDAAHRLIGIKDAQGNEVAYTLDNAGNRTAEQIKDPSGVLQRSINRSFDALNRLQQVSGAVQ